MSLDYEFLKGKVVDAEELVSMIVAQVDDTNTTEVELGDRIISLIFSHAEPTSNIVKQASLETFTIYCGMGSSNDWAKLGITKEQHQFLNDIGYKGADKMGYHFEDYLNEIHKDKYKYQVEHTACNHGEYTDTYKVSRVSIK
jgi:hypothetical protein